MKSYLAAAAVLAATVLLAGAAPALAHGGPVAATDHGAVRGLTADGVDKFLGIPFAAPPVGALRWRPPQPAARWRGVRDATTLPNRCPQAANSNGPRSETEDCLYLSVYRPQGFARHLPVLFWIHGGGLTTGSGTQHDGALIARTDHVVVVAINYRLGALGFLALPGVGSGNFGLMDQRAALRWTAANIRNFGGDPRNVTIAGESAGGFSVCAILASPSMRGLFSRAVMQSGSCPSQTLAAAQKSGAAFASALGCSDAACLRAKPVSALLDANPQPASSFTVDGDLLPVAPADAIASGHFTRVPTLFGSNRNEGRTFSQGFAGFTQAQYEGFVRSVFGARADAVLQRYPWSAYPSPYTAAYAIGDIFTDSGLAAGIGGCTAQTLAQQLAAATRTYAYEFDDPNAPHLNNSLPGYQWGAGHAMELAYMWPSFDNGIPLYPQLTPAQLQLSRQMVRYWGAFAWLGAPFVPGQPYWPEYSSRRMLSLRPGGQTTPIADAQYSAEHMCAFWDQSSST
jgi:para-nitrobenzyl esterase